MSFHSRLMPVLRQDLVDAGVVAELAAAYPGRRAQDKTRTDVEVFLQRLNAERVGTGFQAVELRPYALRVRKRVGTRGASQTGVDELDELETLLEQVCDRYHGSRPFVVDLPEIVSVSAQEEEVDTDPEESGVLEGRVRLVFEITSSAGVLLPVPGGGEGFGEGEFGEEEMGE